MSLAERAIALYQQFQLNMSIGTDPSDALGQWKALSHLTCEEIAKMDICTRRVIAGVASNVRHQASAMMEAEQAMDARLEELSGQLDNLFMRNEDGRTPKRKLDISRPTSNYPTTKRQCRTPSDQTHQSHQSLKSITSLPTPTIEDLDPVRQFFLENISYPYPTPSQKDALCSQANITRRKLESDLTNWRRRSEWTEMMNLYCGGDKGLMKRLVEDIESGTEVDEEIRERYLRMKGYLEKKDEQPGEWVYELAAKIENGELDAHSQARAAQSEIDSMRFVEVELDLEGLEAFSDSDPDASPNPVANLDAEGDKDADEEIDTDEDEDEDEDAEGESELSSHPTSSSSEINCAPQPQPNRHHSSSDSEASLPSVSPTPPPPKKVNKKNKNKGRQAVMLGSPISPPQVPVPVRALTTPRALVPQWSAEPNPSDLFPLVKKNKRTSSAKSSYSSLSAVSNLAAGVHSRSISGSTSLRSVSSSSSNTNPNPASTTSTSTSSLSLMNGLPIDPRLVHLKRPAPAQRFARSSRARVEDILSENENEEEPQWVLAPYPLAQPDAGSGSGFHIGSAPLPHPSHEMSMSLPYIPYDQSGTGTGVGGGVGSGYVGDLTPYMMVPDAWSTDSAFTYLPHISQLQAQAGSNNGMDAGAGMGVGYGSFDMPPEYDFTFTQEPASAK